MSIKLNANRLQLKLSLFTDQTLYFLFKVRRARVIKYNSGAGDLLMARARRYVFGKNEKKN